MDHDSSLAGSADFTDTDIKIYKMVLGQSTNTHIFLMTAILAAVCVMYTSTKKRLFIFDMALVLILTQVLIGCQLGLGITLSIRDMSMIVKFYYALYVLLYIMALTCILLAFIVTGTVWWVSGTCQTCHRKLCVCCQTLPPQASSFHEVLMPPSYSESNLCAITEPNAERLLSSVPPYSMRASVMWPRGATVMCEGRDETPPCNCLDNICDESAPPPYYAIQQ